MSRYRYRYDLAYSYAVNAVPLALLSTCEFTSIRDDILSRYDSHMYLVRPVGKTAPWRGLGLSEPSPLKKPIRLSLILDELLLNAFR